MKRKTNEDNLRAARARLRAARTLLRQPPPCHRAARARTRCSVAHERLAAMTTFKVGDRVRHKYAPATCVGVVLDARELETRVRVDPSIYDVPQPDERWIPNYNLEHEPRPVAHKHSPVLVDPAAPGSERTVAVLYAPVDERKVAEAYREKVLEAFREWDMRPGDTRTWHQVVMEVDLP